MDIILLYICLSCLFYNILICHGYKRVCYYTNWSQYRKGIGRFVPENIDVNLCTHLIYAFAKLDGNQLAPVEWNDDTTHGSKGMYGRLNYLKLENPSLKTLLAVGGWNVGSKPFSDMASVPASRSEFVNSTMTFLRKRNFDGLDLDWEYPGNHAGSPQDKVNLASLVKELRLSFEEESNLSRRPSLLLTMAVPADEEKIYDGYDVPVIAKYVDFVNLMSYNFHGAWDPTTGHNSPLFARAKEVGYAAQKNVKWAAEYWVKLGTPRDKLIIGFSIFGRGFTLMDSAVHKIGAPVTGGSTAGPHTKETGYISYYEVCALIDDGAHVYRDPEQKVPHLVLKDQWIGYDDIESFTEKAIWVKQNKFGGVMLWSLELDDFTGTACETGLKFPMATTLFKLLTMQHASQLHTNSTVLTSDILAESSNSTLERTGSLAIPLSLHTGLQTNDTNISGLFDNADVKSPISHKTFGNDSIASYKQNETAEAIVVTTMQVTEVINNKTVLESNSRLEESKPTDLSGLTKGNNNESSTNISKIDTVSEDFITESAGKQNETTLAESKLTSKTKATNASSLHTDLTEPQHNSNLKSLFVSGRENLLEAVPKQSVTTPLLNDAELQTAKTATRVVITNAQDKVKNTSPLVDTTIGIDNAMYPTFIANIESFKDNKSLKLTEQSEKMPDNTSLVDEIDSGTVLLRTTTVQSETTTTIPLETITKRHSNSRTKSRKSSARSKNKSNFSRKKDRATSRSSAKTGDTIDTNRATLESDVNLISVLGSLPNLVSHFATENRWNARMATDSTVTAQEQNRDPPAATERPKAIPAALQKRLIQTLIE